MARTGDRPDPYRAFNFRVEIEGLITGGFSECNGLQVEVEVKEYREGGVNDYVDHFAGRVKHPPLVFKRGLSAIDGLWLWYQDAAGGRVRRKNGTVYLLNEAHLPVMRWDFKQAFPTKWIGPDLRADANSVAFESIELVHRGLKWI
jgi:phage tail-like protein